MEKKILITAIVAFILGFGIYALFVSHKAIRIEDNYSETITTSTTEVSTSSEDVPIKPSIYTAKINTTQGVSIFLNDKEIGVVSNAVLKSPGSVFVSVHKIGKTGDQFFVVIRHSDELGDFGIISGKSLSYSPLTKNSGIKNVGSGIIFSPEKKYAAFQYVRDNGECKKDLMLGVVDLQSGKLSYPDVKRSYEIGTGVWQAEMGGYRFDGDEYLQFVDMPRACNGAGNYDAQIYYSWKIATGEIMPMSF